MALAWAYPRQPSTFRHGTLTWSGGLPIALPAAVALAGSALKDPIATIGLTMVLLMVQSLYGSFRSWAVRSLFGLLSLPAALIAAPTPIGAMMDLGRSIQLIRRSCW